MLQSFCYSGDTTDLKKIALRVIEKDANASLVDVTSELEAHMNIRESLKTLENLTSQPETVNVIQGLEIRCGN